jgi:hypothetical protein
VLRDLDHNQLQEELGKAFDAFANNQYDIAQYEVEFKPADILEYLSRLVGPVKDIWEFHGFRFKVIQFQDKVGFRFQRMQSYGTQTERPHVIALWKVKKSHVVQDVDGKILDNEMNVGCYSWKLVAPKLKEIAKVHVPGSEFVV